MGELTNLDRAKEIVIRYYNYRDGTAEFEIELSALAGPIKQLTDDDFLDPIAACRKDRS